MRNPDFKPSPWDNCPHEWKEVDSQFEGEVICTICRCPGSIEGDDVYWPAT